MYATTGEKHKASDAPTATGKKASCRCGAASTYLSRPDFKEANEDETNNHDLLEKMVVLAGGDIPKKIFEEDWLEIGGRTGIIDKWASK